MTSETPPSPTRPKISLERINGCLLGTAATAIPILIFAVQLNSDPFDLSGILFTLALGTALFFPITFVSLAIFLTSFHAKLPESMKRSFVPFVIAGVTLSLVTAIAIDVWTGAPSIDSDLLWPAAIGGSAGLGFCCGVRWLRRTAISHLKQLLFTFAAIACIPFVMWGAATGVMGFQVWLGTETAVEYSIRGGGALRILRVPNAALSGPAFDYFIEHQMSPDADFSFVDNWSELGVPIELELIPTNDLLLVIPPHRKTVLMLDENETWHRWILSREIERKNAARDTPLLLNSRYSPLVKLTHVETENRRLHLTVEHTNLPTQTVVLEYARDGSALTPISASLPGDPRREHASQRALAPHTGIVTFTANLDEDPNVEIVVSDSTTLAENGEYVWTVYAIDPNPAESGPSYRRVDGEFSFAPARVAHWTPNTAQRNRPGLSSWSEDSDSPLTTHHIDKGRLISEQLPAPLANERLKDARRRQYSPLILQAPASVFASASNRNH